MTVSLLDLHCLNALCDDYENIDAITAEVRKAAHGNVAREEMEECLRALVSDGMVTAFAFDAKQSKYVPLETFESGLSSNWFFITEEGRRELESNWVDE